MVRMMSAENGKEGKANCRCAGIFWQGAYDHLINICGPCARVFVDNFLSQGKTEQCRVDYSCLRVSLSTV